MMIISHCIGGLGNQLFQYAAGRTLALRYNVPLKMDISGFDSYDLRKFELPGFHASFSIATETEIKKLKPANNFSKAVSYLKPKRYRTYHREHFFHYDPSFMYAGPDTYLKGNFQSELYFREISAVLKEELRIRESLITACIDYGNVLAGENSIAVHIRRGDYTKKTFLEYHGLCPKEYYQEAMHLIQSKVQDPVFYFFSDDIPWTKDNLDIPGARYVSGNTTSTHFEDLYLMSRCRHAIIANSSFSWWGAWLNPNPGKIIIGPKNWFGPRGPKDTRDILPADWISL